MREAFAYDVPDETSIVKPPIPFPQCMPDQYKVEGDPVAAYRNYYKGEKAYFARWNKGRASPEWWDDDMQNFVKHFVTTEELLSSVGE